MNIREKIDKLGLRVLYEELNPGIRGFLSEINGIWHVIVNKNDPPERQNFTLAHEYFEYTFKDDTELLPEEKHRKADICASELLLPEESFKPAAAEFGLHELKKIFPHVSYEAIARRYIRFVPAVVTIFDNMVCTSRFASEGMNYPHTPSEVERTIAIECAKSHETAHKFEPPLDVSGYILDEKNSIIRIFVIARIVE
ncbi:ImmA/IrrE family metallo-endopeptidase [candidate division KSB1 bacterium]